MFGFFFSRSSCTFSTAPRCLESLKVLNVEAIVDPILARRLASRGDHTSTFPERARSGARPSYGTYLRNSAISSSRVWYVAQMTGGRRGSTIGPRNVRSPVQAIVDDMLGRGKGITRRSVKVGSVDNGFAAEDGLRTKRRQRE